MKDLIVEYISNPEFRNLTLKVAISKIENIKPEWIYSHHKDFDKKLIDIMQSKNAEWQAQGINTSEIELDIIVNAFNLYKKHYRVRKPPEILDLEEKLKILEATQPLLSEPGIPMKLRHQLQMHFNTSVEYFKAEIKKLS